jgi:hypothetical protein
MSPTDIKFYLVIAGDAVGGACLFMWAKPLSRMYNAWTTRFRTKYPNINPPPTPKAAELNHKIMVILFRLLGVTLFLTAVWAVYAVYFLYNPGL